MSAGIKKIVVVLSLMVVVYMTAGYVMARSSDDNAFRALTVYSEVLDHIQRFYVDQPNMKRVTNGALHGLFNALDPDSSYMSPLEFKDYEQKIATPAKAGSGLALTKSFGYISVISALPDSPGAKSKLGLGDIIERIAGFTTAQMGVNQAEVLLSGDPGTVVQLSVIHRGKTEPESVKLTLEPTPPTPPVVNVLPGGVGYLHVEQFSKGATAQVRDALEQLKKEGAKKLILDLRDCALGRDAEGISTAQLFLSSGTITTLKGQTVAPVVSTADPSNVVWTDPVAVLIGNGTAGPAEILAAAIADNHRGDTVGNRTYGTASEQKLIKLEDGAAIILTVANYYTPAGKEIPMAGVTPTYVVQRQLDDIAELTQMYPPAPSSSLNDPAVKKALQVLQGTTRKAA